jgi:CubicO group peptidase (beta-lactamase class C family)
MKIIPSLRGNINYLPVKISLSITILLLLCILLPATVFAQSQDVQKKLKGFDQYMEKLLKDWNTPGVGVGIVVKDKLVFVKGYGYRDYEKKLPVTPNTLFQIASNTKLFTAAAIGLLVEEKKLDWDKPVQQYVPIIQFYNDELNNTVTIRDMLSHRTGISRHDVIWYKSDLTRKELFDRLKYLEPSQPLRQGFLYNNMMYAASGYIIEYLTQKTWEDFVSERIFKPLDMTNTVFTIQEMEQNPDHGVPYNEKRDTTLLYRIPYYEDVLGMGPAGSIVSSINDMSHWLIALMNGGKYRGKQVIPENVVKATLEPSIALPNTGLENKGYKELLNSVYGMGRWSASYRGHYLAYHGGDLPGFHSHISCMPYDSIGVVVFVIGDHSAPLYNVIAYNVYERLLGLDQTPWSQRRLEDRIKGKQAGREGRQKAGQDRITNTKPSHPLSDYVGEYEHPAYGIVTISMKDTTLQFDFHKIVLPLYHYHYDRFDTPDDEENGLWSLNFYTNPQGDIDRTVFSLDESEATFVRKVSASLTDPNVLKQYAGKYEYAGATIEVVLKPDNHLYLSVPGQPTYELIPVKTHQFKVKQFADYTFVFVVENGKVTSLKQIDPSGEYELKRKE